MRAALRTSNLLLGRGRLAAARGLLLGWLTRAWGSSLGRLDIALGRLVLAQYLLGAMEGAQRSPCQISLDEHLTQL